MGHAVNDNSLAEYDVRLAQLAKRVEVLGRRAATIESESGSIVGVDLETARAGLRLAASVIAEAQKISGEVCIQLGSMSERLNEIATILDRLVIASAAREDFETDFEMTGEHRAAPVRLH